jgi:hypothetical protein
MLILFGFGLADYLVNLGECIAGELILGKWKMRVLHTILYRAAYLPIIQIRLSIQTF